MLESRFFSFLGGADYQTRSGAVEEAGDYGGAGRDGKRWDGIR
jgi:hypothetical protein